MQKRLEQIGNKLGELIIEKYGTSEGAMAAWDTRGRGRKAPEKSETKVSSSTREIPSNLKETGITSSQLKQVLDWTGAKDAKDWTTTLKEEFKKEKEEFGVSLREFAETWTEDYNEAILEEGEINEKDVMSVSRGLKFLRAILKS